MSIKDGQETLTLPIDDRNEPADCGIDLSGDAEWDQGGGKTSLVNSDTTDAAVTHQIRIGHQLQQMGVSQRDAQALVSELIRGGEFDFELPPSDQFKMLAPVLQKKLRTTGPLTSSPGEQRVVAFVGPTGVGKTTTIAKLASNLRLRENKQIGLITVDTYRIAAVDQLRTYAQIIDVPLEVVATPKEMQSAISRLSDCELLLIDTAGRSPQNDQQLQELKSVLAAASTNEVHLVLNAVSSNQNLALVIDKFNRVGVDALVISKVDESASLTNFVQVAIDTNLPFSYLSNGQNVPDDIELASSAYLAEAFLNCQI